MASPTVAEQRSTPVTVSPRPRPRVPAWLGWCTAAAVVSGAVYLLAWVLHRYAIGRGTWVTVGSALLNAKWRNLAECAAIAVAAGAALCFPRLQKLRARRLEQAIARFAAHRIQAILLVAALPMLIRLALVPVLGVPEPLVADEFGYLLLADTFASGHLTNPTHPLWKFFETVYVFHQPSYNSIYPVAPALLLAAAKAVGAHPWFGVWLGTGVMCGLFCWMLQGWAPPKWALLGGLLAVGKFAIVGPWMNTYWGGATAAAGGALLLGALPRILKQHRIRDSVLFTLGLAILAQSRPFEGMLFAAPLTGALAYWLLRERRVAFRVRVLRVAAPLAAGMAMMVAATAWYNSSVTGDPLLPPYLLHQRIYGTPQTLFWQPPIANAPGAHNNRDIADVFQWQLDAHQAHFSWSAEGVRMAVFWQFYFQPLWTLPLLLLPLAMARSRLIPLAASAVLLLVGNAMYPFFFPHYAAPMCGLILLFVVQGLRRLRWIRMRGRLVGAPMFRALVCAMALSAVCTAAGSVLEPWFVAATYTPRGEALRQLTVRGGKHVVFVRYSPHHEFHYGVIFNDADIDGSPVVWAHDMGPEANKALVSYYADREAWLFNPDEAPVTLTPLTDKPYISAVAAGAGRRDDTMQGVSPGGIAVVLGGNFARERRGSTPGRLLGDVPVRLLNASAELGDLFGGAGEDEAVDEDPGVSVQFGAVRAKVLAVSNLDGQEAVTVQVPWRTPAGETVVRLESGGLAAVKRITILAATPGIFQMRMSDGGVRGIVLHGDGSLVDLQHPSHPGETLRMLVTGLGRQAGRRLIVGVNHRGAPLVSVNDAPGVAGVELIGFQIPREVPAGKDVPLSIGVVVGGRTVYSNKSSVPVE